MQTVSKAWQTRKEITLAEGARQNGEELSLGLLNSNMTLGAVTINKASVKKNDDFALVRNGENSVMLSLKTGSVNVKRNKSYTVKLELWPEGTYKMQGEGANAIPVAIEDGNKKAKPTLVSVKVNIK
jgi:hypothetical protein